VRAAGAGAGSSGVEQLQAELAALTAEQVGEVALCVARVAMLPAAAGGGAGALLHACCCCHHHTCRLAVLPRLLTPTGAAAAGLGAAHMLPAGQPVQDKGQRGVSAAQV
jgi:hypothetical protein